jgi:hypothetical protein
MTRKRFIAQQGGRDLIKVFEAETGQLYRTISVMGNITSPPICNDHELYVGVTDSSGLQQLMYFSAPNFNLSRTVSI